MIRVQSLCKKFTTRRKLEKPGLFRRTEEVSFSAVKNISFDIAAGERVAFIGPNGAGKSTTLKMLSGILQPSNGSATVAGFVPWKQQQQLAYEIGLVFGQRSQLWYHLPVRQSFDLLGKIYDLTKEQYERQLTKLEKVFHLTPLLDSPVKSLSLGQRMRCEIAVSLLHSPKLLFLDEPTIGLDVTSKAELRQHLRQLSVEDGTTVILTSHDTADIEEICDRVIIINRGEKLIDTSLAKMRQSYLRQKLLVFTTAEETPQLDLPQAVNITTESHKLLVEIDPTVTPVAGAISLALEKLTIHDISVSDVPLEVVIKHIYAEVPHD